jgi:hypothetical protein
MKDFTGLNYSDRWIFFVTTAMFAVGYRILAILAFRFVSHIKR